MGQSFVEGEQSALGKLMGRLLRIGGLFLGEVSVNSQRLMGRNPQKLATNT